MEYLLMISVGIIIGMLIIIAINTKKTKDEEKQFFEEYKELIDKYFTEDNSKKTNSNKT